MNENERTLLKLVNASGFVFQLRIEHQIEKTRRDHGWEFTGREHRWADPESGAEGYIDIVLQRDNMRIGIECKRLKEDTNWVFLISDQSDLNKERARLLWTYQTPDTQQPNPAEWDDFRVTPSSPESAFCVVWGHSDKSKPMLERLSDIVLPSLECLAEEELQLGQHKPDGKIYIPIIVTNANLKLCLIENLNEVDISSGELQSANAHFETVSFIRFRKALSTKLSSRKRPHDLIGANQAKERTVFIVHAADLTRFLNVLDVSTPLQSRFWPWEAPDLYLQHFP